MMKDENDVCRLNVIRDVMSLVEIKFQSFYEFNEIRISKKIQMKMFKWQHLIKKNKSYHTQKKIKKK